jgi:hypothetical protein
VCHPAYRRALVFAQHLELLVRLRRIRDRIDRECARPLDVEALARAAGMPVERLCRQFRLAYGRAPEGYLLARRAEGAGVLPGHAAPGVTYAVRVPAGTPGARPGVREAREPAPQLA